MNDQDIGNFDDDISFDGYLRDGGDNACVYVNDEPTGNFIRLGWDTSTTVGSSLWGQTGYAFSYVDDILPSEWGCVLPLDGTAESFVKIQVAESGCAMFYSGAQEDIDYVWDDGTNLGTCYTGNSNWVGFLGDCPVSADSPVIRVTATRAATYPSGCGAQCASGSQCGDGDDCTEDICDANNLCSNPNEPAGTTCDVDGVCDGSGNCIDCLDHDDCAAGEFCDTGTCVVDVCDVDADCGTNECLDYTCDNVNNSCSSVPGDEGTVCEGTKVCDDTGTCEARVCTVATQDVDCDDNGNVCTDNVCNEITNECSNPADSGQNGVICDGGTYECEDGACLPPYCERAPGLDDPCPPGQSGNTRYQGDEIGGTYCDKSALPTDGYCFNLCGSFITFDSDHSVWGTPSGCNSHPDDWEWVCFNPGILCENSQPIDCRHRCGLDVD